jgi:uncharacterized membrane protein
VKRPALDARLLLALAITVFFWAAAFAGIRAALESYGPGELALLRLLVASTTLALYAAAVRMRLLEWRDFPAIFAAGFFAFALYHVGLNFGELTVSAGAASLLINTAPIFTALLATAFLGERLKAAGWVGMIVSFLGASLISVGEGQGYGFDLGAVPMLLAAVSVSVYLVSRLRPAESYLRGDAGRGLSRRLPDRRHLRYLRLHLLADVGAGGGQLSLPHTGDGVFDRLGLARRGASPPLGCRRPCDPLGRVPRQHPR